MRKVFITDTEWPTCEEVLQEALNCGACEVLHGIPDSLKETIPEDTLGYYEIDEPVPTYVIDELTPEEEINKIKLEIQALLSRLDTIQEQLG